MFKRLLLLCAFTFSISSIASIDEQSKNLLKELVDINSGTSNLSGVESVRKRLIPEFTKLGYVAEVVEGGQGRKVLSFRFKDAQPKILLIGHVDTVFNKDSAFQKFSETADIFSGPGVNDMKGGIVMMLAVLRDLKEKEILSKIAIVLNDDEEVGSTNSAAILKKFAAGIPYGLIYEPTMTSHESVTTSQAGVKWLELKVKGQAAHAGAEHHKGINACVELSHKIIEMAKLTNYTKKLTVNPGVIKGGTKGNVVCEEATAAFDIRFVEDKDLEALLKKVSLIAKKNFIYNKLLKRGTETTINDFISIPSLPPKSTQFIFDKAAVVAKSLNMNLQREHMGGASDGNQLAPTGILLLGGLGPWGTGAHSTNEMMDAKSFDLRKALSVGLIRELLKGE